MDDKPAFMKIYFCAKEKENGEDKLIITIVPITRQNFGDEGTAIHTFAKKCTAAIGRVMDERSDEEKSALRKEVREYLAGVD